MIRYAPLAAVVIHAASIHPGWTDAVRIVAAPEIDPDTVTPGVIGFFAIFFVAAAVVLLMVDMTRRIRRTRYRAEVGERLDAEEAAIAQAERDETDRIIRPLDFDSPTPDDRARPDRD